MNKRKLAAFILIFSAIIIVSIYKSQPQPDEPLIVDDVIAVDADGNIDSELIHVQVKDGKIKGIRE